jgi:hypothetical protein
MKLLSCIVLSLILFTHPIHAQEAQQAINMYKFKLFHEKRLKPFNMVKMSLEISTAEGKFPATLTVIENMAYKLEVQFKKGKSIEFIDLNKYLLMSANEKEKQYSEANAELYFRKKLLLNFYPFLHDKPEFPFMEIQQGIVANSLGAVVDASTEAQAPVMPEDPTIRKYVQFLQFNNMSHTYHLDMKEMNLVKIETRYYLDDKENIEVKKYTKFKQSAEGYSYPSEFTTVFGDATVKSIQFDPKLTSLDLNIDF